MNTAEQGFLRLRAERSSSAATTSDGLYHCNHCGDAVTPTVAQIELAENAPDSDPALKCPHCHRHTVHWRMPLPARAKPGLHSVSVSHGRELFAGIYRMLAEM
jgi:DNA-directed RNA polymerase subunit RPC12/RpoP